MVWRLVLTILFLISLSGRAHSLVSECEYELDLDKSGYHLIDLNLNSKAKNSSFSIALSFFEKIGNYLMRSKFDDVGQIDIVQISPWKKLLWKYRIEPEWKDILETEKRISKTLKIYFIEEPVEKRGVYKVYFFEFWIYDEARSEFVRRVRPDEIPKSLLCQFLEDSVIGTVWPRRSGFDWTKISINCFGEDRSTQIRYRNLH